MQHQRDEEWTGEREGKGQGKGKEKRKERGEGEEDHRHHQICALEVRGLRTICRWIFVLLYVYDVLSEWGWDGRWRGVWWRQCGGDGGVGSSLVIITILIQSRPRCCSE